METMSTQNQLVALSLGLLPPRLLTYNVDSNLVMELQVLTWLDIRMTHLQLKRMRDVQEASVEKKQLSAKKLATTS